jgi:hypothetical protein
MSAANPNPMERSMVSVLVVANTGGGVAVAVWCGLVIAEFHDSLFDFVEALFVFAVHRARFLDLFAEEDKVVLYPLGVLTLWRCWRSRIVWVRDHNSVIISSINFSISSIKSRIGSIFRKVHKGLERVPRLFGLWGAELARFWWHFAWWGEPKLVKTLISQ